MNIDFTQFKALAQSFNLIPIFKSISSDLETPVSAFLKLQSGGRLGFLLESVEGGNQWGRYSFLGVDPLRIFSFEKGKMFAIDPKNRNREELPFTQSPLEVLRTGYVDYQVYQDKDLPRFFGGLVGYVGYDSVQYFEKVQIQKEDFELPLIHLMHTDTVVIFDRLENNLKIVSSVSLQEFPGANEKQLQILYDQACDKIASIEKLLLQPLSVPSKKQKTSVPEATVSMLRDEYCDIVAKAKDYIVAGDIMQVVLSLRFEKQVGDLDPFEVYRKLRQINPSPYMYYLDCGEFQVVGASPEVLVRFEQGQAHVRPIAGTRPRGKTEQQDLALEQELLNDPKENAEHVMLLDLGRNDIGRVAKIGSVTIDQNSIIEKYSHVMHLVSHVSGEVLKDKDMFDVLAATFPAGTLSGAPKVRAMQIIDELESLSRGIYGGGVGYMSYSGNLDFAIAIRTAWFHQQTAFVQAGAGVVADSIPEKEYEECCHKAKGMLAAIDEGST